MYDVGTFLGADDRKPYTLAEPGIAITADELAALLAAGGDDEVRALLAAGQAAEAIAITRFAAFPRRPAAGAQPRREVGSRDA